jgi:hypothetical protein
LWLVVYETYYQSHYQELEADRLVARWQKFDDVVKTVVAITASSSAIAGWALWSNPGFKSIWACLAGLGALLAVVHASLGVPGRLKDWGEIQRFFIMLRIDLETMQYRMRVEPEFALEPFTRELVECRKRYGDGFQRVKNDLLRTERLRLKAQEDLDDLIAAKYPTREERV